MSPLGNAKMGSILFRQPFSAVAFDKMQDVREVSNGD